MAGYCSCTRLSYWLLLAFLTLCAFAAPGSASQGNEEWIGWAFMAAMVAVLMMIDAMFFSSPADFAFDPNVSSVIGRKRRMSAACWMLFAAHLFLSCYITHCPPPSSSLFFLSHARQLKNYARNQARFE